MAVTGAGRWQPTARKCRRHRRTERAANVGRITPAYRFVMAGQKRVFALEQIPLNPICIRRERRNLRTGQV